MTTQIQSTMIQTCRILFKTRAENFELLPSGGYGTWGFYTEYLGLHYYLMVIDTTRSNTIYDTSNTDNYEYNAVRTNYKIQDLIMVPSECVGPDDEINFDDIIDPKCHNTTMRAEYSPPRQLYNTHLYHLQIDTLTLFL